MVNRWFAACAAALALCCSTGAAHAARYWVSNELGDVPPEQVVKVAAPQPVQLLFQFKTNGNPNARATKYLNDKITEIVTGRGTFSEVSTAPTANGAILQITIDDQGDTKAAASKGFATGLTFGLKGNTVSDNYVATAEYVGSAGATAITKEVRHTLFTTIGNTDPPPNTTQVKKVDDAVQTVTQQMLAHLLNDLAKDPAFAGAAPPAAATPSLPGETTAAPVPAPASAAPPTSAASPESAPSPVATP